MERGCLHCEVTAHAPDRSGVAPAACGNMSERWWRRGPRRVSTELRNQARRGRRKGYRPWNPPAPSASIRGCGQPDYTSAQARRPDSTAHRRAARRRAQNLARRRAQGFARSAELVGAESHRFVWTYYSRMLTKSEQQTLAQINHGEPVLPVVDLSVPISPVLI